ncbi:DEAD/DEAH box helicase [Aestuariivirga sp.]|jgi:non-specific serine/threonine protein kinase|uniref:DEAD/DEAH box helicase n=1 Tax=Aestuariivirga sp. TaxID=2650926 RepID=UPI0037831B8E
METLALTSPADGKIERAFIRGHGHGLLALALDATAAALPFDLAFWRDFGSQFMTALCARPERGDVSGPALIELPVPGKAELDEIANSAPPMFGGEYLTSGILAEIWVSMGAALSAELTESGQTLADFLRLRGPAWSIVGRVHFNLAENRKDEESPFAFLATYTSRLSDGKQAQHVPLGRALQEYAGADNRERLLSLLLPVQKAAGDCGWLKSMVDSGEIYHPLRWTPADAQQFLRDAPILERAGIVLRMPAAWKMGRPIRPQVQASVGTRAPSLMGLDAMLDFDFAVSLDGETLSADEVKQLLAQTDGLALVRGKWVEIDRDRLARTLELFEAVERRADEGGLPFTEAMRLVSGASLGSGNKPEILSPDWSQTVAGPWLAETLAALRQPAMDGASDPGPALKATLRPYQKEGVAWLALLTRLGLGACLADDMGLGKTIQVISLLLVLKRDAGLREGKARGHAKIPEAHRTKPSILVVPASLIGNWSAEIARFAPSLRYVIAHSSVMNGEDLQGLTIERLADIDLVITTYGTLMRMDEFQAITWRLAILDEAQAIKNANTKQTLAVKKLKADARIAMTGTPVENRLGDLWSLFDFINPGLVGSAREFTSFIKRLAERTEAGPATPGRVDYGPLRSLVRPYILRRMKTDKSIISDLPDKTEVKTFCALSKLQAALYQQTVAELAKRLQEASGIQRKGLVLTTLMRLKQICNHPSQWLGDAAWREADSGKLLRLKEIASQIAERQEKVLVFTQFKEITAPLASCLARTFGREGLVLTGETAVTKRKDLVRRFQENESIPFFVLSLKAGGAGLNLTAASHVVHFDRWWNPAVENQATDRAFRIGQKRNVLVHKFVCQGTVEDRIDRMIEEKSMLAGDILEGVAEVLLTELSDSELMRLVTLDLGSAMKDE